MELLTFLLSFIIVIAIAIRIHPTVNTTVYIFKYCQVVIKIDVVALSKMELYFQELCPEKKLMSSHLTLRGRINKRLL